MAWTRPADLRRQVQRLWDRGRILSSLATRESMFPLRLALKRPSAAELRDHFDEARSWSKSLRSMPHLRIAMREFRHRVSGANALPHEVWIDTVEDAAALIGKRHEVAAFERVVEATGARQPSLLPWIARRPLNALQLADDWNLLLDVVGWLRDHPRPGIYLRQMDVPGVHSKFVESRRGVIGELLDCVLPPESIDASAAGVAGFARRYGFRDKPERIRFRILDSTHALLPGDRDQGAGSQDVTLDATTFAALDTCVSRVFVTENEINFLAFPNIEGGMVVFGAGYGFESLRRARWLSRCRLFYWGDIDTHGFAILDELRSHFGLVESFLMDRETFDEFEPLWGMESSPLDRDLSRLTAERERPPALYDDLRFNRLIGRFEVAGSFPQRAVVVRLRDGRTRLPAPRLHGNRMLRGNHGSHATRRYRHCPWSRRRCVPRPVRGTVQANLPAHRPATAGLVRRWRPVGSARSISRALLLRAGEVAVVPPVDRVRLTGR